MSFAGRTALITGGARGIGFAIASRLASQGARVAIVDRDGPGATAAASRIGREAMAVVADVTQPADTERAVTAVLDRWGRLDIVVNNAGITGRSVPLWELTDDDWHSVLACDLTSVFLVSRAAVRVMLETGSGRIINIASIAGLVNFPTFLAYSASKAAVHSITQGTRLMLAAQGTTVIGVYPGPVDTDMAEKLPWDKVTPAQATSASSSMSPEQAWAPVPPVAGWSPASTSALPVSTRQAIPASSSSP